MRCKINPVASGAISHQAEVALADGVGEVEAAVAVSVALVVAASVAVAQVEAGNCNQIKLIVVNVTQLCFLIGYFCALYK